MRKESHENDPGEAVRRKGRRTVGMSPLKRVFWGLVFVAFGSPWLYQTGNVSLECERSSSGAMDCRETRVVLGVVPVWNEGHENVQGADTRVIQRRWTNRRAASQATHYPWSILVLKTAEGETEVMDWNENANPDAVSEFHRSIVSDSWASYSTPETRHILEVVSAVISGSGILVILLVLVDLLFFRHRM
jgi:hypothetical protein